jgi:hypothetical protein
VKFHWMRALMQPQEREFHVRVSSCFYFRAFCLCWQMPDIHSCPTYFSAICVHTECGYYNWVNFHLNCAVYVIDLQPIFSLSVPSSDRSCIRLIDFAKNSFPKFKVKICEIELSQFFVPSRALCSIIFKSKKYKKKFAQFPTLPSTKMVISRMKIKKLTH